MRVDHGPWFQRQVVFTSALLAMSCAAAGGCGGAEECAPGQSAEGVSSACTPSSGVKNGKGIFDAREPWSDDVSTLAKSPSSDATMEWLASHGGWGPGTLRIDFMLNLLHGDGSTPFQSFTPTDDFFAPDCDDVPFPLPPGGALEDEDGYECKSDGDCHLLVLHAPTHKLYEMWRANLSGGVFQGGCAAVWNLEESYSPNGRGEGCTSADAGGMPIAPLTFSADEIAAGAIDHAIRFVLPKDRIRNGSYVHPATHSTKGASGGPDAPPFGVRLRLRADFPLDILSPGPRVIARALQKYGMILADQGNITLTALSDRFTTHKWSDVGVVNNSLVGIDVKDMEVVDEGKAIPYTGHCVRTP
jgi:hypothetical protein